MEKERIKEKDGAEQVIGTMAVKEIGGKGKGEWGKGGKGYGGEGWGKGDGTKGGGTSGAIKGKGKGKGKGKKGMNEFGYSNNWDWWGK